MHIRLVNGFSASNHQRVNTV